MKFGDELLRGATVRRVIHGDIDHELRRPEPRIALVVESLKMHWRWPVGCAAACLLAALVYLVAATPEYTATSLILIDTKSNASVRSNTPTATDANVESAAVESLIEVLRSERTMQRVVQAENLADDPALAPGALASLVQWVTRQITFRRPSAQEAEQKVVAAARALQKRTTMRRIGLTYAVEISVTWPDPVRSADIANAISAAFVGDQAELREENARRLSALFESRTKQLAVQAQQAEAAVEQLKFSGSVAGESSAAARVKLKELESAAQTYRMLHDKFLERFAESSQQQFLAMPDAQVVSKANPPQGKSSPKSLITLAAALFIGCAAGMIVILLRDRRLLGLPA
ncbi:MAG: hypothetical protein JO048_11580 [Methylobacteriaceae bacterium]|nr:hypothetical protein [Methylobacteriaceae bacterium]